MSSTGLYQDKFILLTCVATLFIQFGLHTTSSKTWLLHLQVEPPFLTSKMRLLLTRIILCEVADTKLSLFRQKYTALAFSKPSLMERSEEEQGLLSSPCSLLETVHHLLWRGAHGSNPIHCMCTCMRMCPCACLKSVSEATPCSFGCWRNCGVEIKGLPTEWCSRGDFTTQPSLLCRGGRLLLAAPLSPLTMYCPLHIPARKKWLRQYLSCVYEWEALHDREWNIQESMKRPSPLPSVVTELPDRLFSLYILQFGW